MKLSNKYIALWTAVWLQFYFFFDELQPMAVAGQFGVKQIMLSCIAIYCIHFIIYFFMLMDRKISASVQKYHEIYFCLFGLLLCGSMLVYMLNNNWLWTEASIGAIILELGKFILMVGTLIIACFFQFIKKEIIDMSEVKLWSTDNTYDLAFWGMLVVMSFLLSLWTSKLPISNRNYYEFVRVFLVDGILLLALNKNRLFRPQRKLFYAVLIGYFFACTFQSIIMLFISHPSLSERLSAIGAKTNYIVVSGGLMVIHWLVLAVWVGWDLLMEDPRTKLKK